MADIEDFAREFRARNPQPAEGEQPPAAVMPERVAPPQPQAPISIEDFALQQRDRAAQRVQAVRGVYKDFGLDDVAAAEDFSRRVKETTGRDIPADAFLGKNIEQTFLDETLYEGVLNSPRLAQWAGESPANAIIADAEKQNLGIIEAMAHGAGRRTEQLVRGVGPRVALANANRQIVAARRAMSDRQLSYAEIMRDEAMKALTENAEKPDASVFDFARSVVDLAAAPIDAAGRYARSRVFDDSVEGVADAQVRGAQRAGELANILAEVGENWGRTASTARVLPELAKIEEMDGFWAQLEAFGDLAVNDPVGVMTFTLETMAESAPALIPALAGYAVGGPTGGALAGGFASYGTSQIIEYTEIAKEHGYDVTDPEQAIKLLQDPAAMERLNEAGHTYAAVVAFFDAASGGIAGTRLTQSVMGEVILQGAVQVVAGGGGEALGRAMSGRDISAVEVVMEMLAEIPGGAADVVTAKAGTAINNRAIQRGVEADRSFFEALATAGEDSETRAKLPEKYREAVGRIVGDGEGSTIYVDAGRLDQLFQSGQVDPALFTEATGLTIEEVQTAAAEGGDVQIATADYAAKIIGTPLDQPLRKNARVNPQRLSEAEAQELQADQQAVQEEIDALAEQAAAGEEQFAAEIETARADFEARLVDAGQVPAVAAANANQMAAVYQTLSRRTGIAPAALVQRFPLPEIDTGRAAAPLEAPLEQGSDQFARWFGNSILRDENGAPRTMYHGTAFDFDQFAPGMVWVGSTPAVANMYAEDRARRGSGRTKPGAVQTGRQIMPLNVRIERPFDASVLDGTVSPETFVTTAAEQARAFGVDVSDEQVASLIERMNASFKRKNPVHEPRMATWLYWPLATENGHLYFDADGVLALREMYALMDFDGVHVIEQGEPTYGVFDPKQVKSIWNSGAYGLDDPRILHQTVPLMRGDETLQGLPKRPTIRDVAIAMEQRARRKRGGIVTGNDAKARDKIARMIVDEVLYEYEQAAIDPTTSAVGWYTTKAQAAIDIVGEVFGELRGDAEALTLPGPASLGGNQQHARDLFTALLAFTSDGATIGDNFTRAVAAYGSWRETAVLSSDGIPGHNRGTLDLNLARLQAVLDREGPEAFRGYLLQRDTVKSLRAAAKAAGVALPGSSDYTTSMVLPRSALEFGPKLGAFYANLMGDTGYLTMDRWWTRSFNRYRGTLVKQPTEAGVARVRDLIVAAEGVDPATLETREQVVAASRKYHESYKKKRFKNGTELEMAANTVYKHGAQELEDKPANAKDRQFMVETATRAQAILKRQGHDITLADLQAVMWYYEKRLFGKMGARQSEDISYEEAARRAAEGYSAGRPADQGTGRPGDTGEDQAGTGEEGHLNIVDAASQMPLQQWRDAMELAGLLDDFDEQAAIAAAAPWPDVQPVEAPLPGLEKSSPGRVPGVRELATDYMAANGLPIRHQAEYVTVDVARATEIARLYDEMPAQPAPEDAAITRAAYEALARETIAQYRQLERLGFSFEWITGDDPYASPREAIRDMQDNGHLWVFPTTDGFGTVNEADADHPLLQPTGIIIDGRDALVNDLFRIVHDVFGHGSEGAAFGARGEENAWQAHVRMFSPLAARAMTAETRGQNSWVNFGPYGEANRANPQNTVFADQKVGLLPEWVSTIGQAQDKPLGEVLGWPTKAEFETAFTPDLLQRDGWFIITGMKEGDGDKDSPRNIAANERLRAVLAERGLDYLPVSGMYKGEPQGESYLVLGDTAEGLALGRAFDQESILTFRGLEYSDGRPDTPQVAAETVVGPAALESDFYSVMPDGTPWTMGLDWGAPETPELFQSAPPVESNAFKAWFGGSKVVDDSGAPLVVHHGSDTARQGDPEFAFQTGRPGRRYVGFAEIDTTSSGLFFTPSRADADSYGGQVGSYYLSVQRPLSDPRLAPISSRATPEERAAHEALWDDVAYIFAPVTEGDPNGDWSVDTNGGVSTVDGSGIEAFVAAVFGQFAQRGEQSGSIEWHHLDNPEVAARMRERGYDGALVEEPNDESGLSWFVLDPTQVKSVDNRGTFDPSDARVLYQSVPPRIYHSPLLEGVRGAKQNKAKGRDWLAILPKMGGVKEAELTFTGVMDWLEGLKADTVTREEVIAFVEQNQVELVEVAGPGKWDRYTERGGENYREFLLTVPKLHELPINEGARPFVNSTHYSDENIVVTARATDRVIDGKRTLFAEEVQSDLASAHRKGGTSWRNLDTAEQAVVDARAQWEAAREDVFARLTAESEGQFDEIAVRQHMMWEVQRAAGDIDIDNDLYSAEIEDFAGSVDPQAWVSAAEAWVAYRRAQGARRKAQPAQPFTPFEEAAAYELAAKRLLQRAAREGYDTFAWTPGYMQARRWDTAAQEVVSDVSWARVNDQRMVVLTMAEGGSAFPVRVNDEGIIVDTDRAPAAWQGQPLSALIGNAAERVMAEEGGAITGANITFPSSGYAVAYDRQIKSAVEKIAKRYGARVSTGGLPVGVKSPSHSYLRGRLNLVQDALYGGDEAAAASALVPESDPRHETALSMIRSAMDEAAAAIREEEATELSLAEKRVADLETYVAAEEDPAMRERFTRRLLNARAALADQQVGMSPEAFLRTQRTRAGRMLDDSTDFWKLLRDVAESDNVQTEDVWKVEINDKMRAALVEPFPLFQEKRGSIVLPRAAGQAPIISLFNGADLSTILHESGHYYLHMLEQLATDPAAPPQLVADWQAVQRWWATNAELIAAEAGVTPEAVIRYLDGGQMDSVTHQKVWRGLHEQFARGIEAYVMEGKAPSIGLRGVFSSIASWLTAVYARVRGDLQVQLNDEVRSVFDRLYATDEEIAQAVAGTDGTVDADTARRLGASEREIDALARLSIEQQEEAQAFMLGVAGGAFRAQRKADYRRRRAQITAEATAAVNARPVYRAIEWMARGAWIGDDWPEGLPAMKLGRALLAESGLDDPSIERLEAMGVVEETGVSPDDAADFFGFQTGDEMVQAMLAAPEQGRAIRQETRNALQREFGNTAGERLAAMPDAMNGDKRGQQLDAELRVLTGLLPGGRTATTRRQAAIIAEQTIRNMPVRRAIRLDDFLAAERRAGRKVQQAILKRDIEAAVRAKREQLFQHTLYVEAKKAAELVGKAERKAKQLQRAGTRKNLAGEYLGAIDEVLETYDFRKISGKAERERGRLKAYLDMMEAAGRSGEVVVSQDVIDETNRVPYKTLTVDRLRGVYDSLRNIEHTAREAHKIKTAERERDIRTAVAEISAEMDANLKDRPTPRARSQRSVLREKLQWYANISLNATTRLRQYGGWEMGDTYMHLKREIDAAGAWENEQRDIAGRHLNGLIERYSASERLAMNKKKVYPQLGGQAFTKWDLLSMALNMGNADNLDRLKGADTAYPLTDGQIEFIKTQLDQRDWRFVQDSWDFIGSFWPLIEAREKRVTGVAPTRVAAQPVVTPYGTLPGGYYPIKYDSELSTVVEAEQLQEQLQAMQAGKFGKAQTRNGHTIARTGSGGRVLAIDISVMFRHVNEVIHDLAFQEATANAWRILRRPEIIDLFSRKGRSADLEMLEIWVQDVAIGGGVGGGMLGRLALTLKGNFTASRLALNTSTALLQATGITHSIAVVGPKWMAIGLSDYIPHVASRRASVLSQSAVMRNRARFTNPDYLEYVNEGQRTNVVSVAGNVARKGVNIGMAPMQFLQFHLVDMPLWLAGQAKALAQGMSPEDAVHYADQMMIRAQGGTSMADRTAFERGSLSRDTRYNGYYRLFATLASYMMVKGNLTYEILGKTSKGIRSGNPVEMVSSAVGAAFYLTLLFGFEELVRGLMKDEIDWDDDDEDKDGLLAYLAKKGAGSMLGTLPFIRDVASGVGGFDVGLYATFGGTIGDAAKEISDMELDRGLRKSLLDALGMVAPLPTGQANRMLDAAGEGSTNPMEYLFGITR